MNKDTLALLSGMAPKEEDRRWAMHDWEKQFYKDYPEPWKPENCFSWAQACYAANCASGRLHSFSLHKLTTAMFFNRFNHEWHTPHHKWMEWMKECRDKFERDELPLIWVKKRLQAAQED